MVSGAVRAARRIAAALIAVGVVLVVISPWTVSYLIVVGVVSTGLGIAWVIKAQRMLRGHGESHLLLRRGFDPDEGHERLGGDGAWHTDL